MTKQSTSTNQDTRKKTCEKKSKKTVYFSNHFTILEYSNIIVIENKIIIGFDKVARKTPQCVMDNLMNRDSISEKLPRVLYALDNLFPVETLSSTTNDLQNYPPLLRSVSI